MKYDLTQVLNDVYGKAIITDENPPQPATLRFVLERACIGADPQKHSGGDTKYRIYKLLQRIHNAETEFEVDHSDVIFLKNLIGELFTVSVVGPVYDVLEDGYE